MPKTILLIDDDPNYIQGMRHALVDGGYEILVATNGQLAFTIAQKHLPDVILTDWDMPDLDGIGTIRLLKQEPSLADIPVIMVTGSMTNSDSLKTALEAGAMDFIRKPVDMIELLARVNTALKLAESTQTIKEQNYELSGALQMRERLMAIIAHDLQSPVVSLKSSLAMIRAMDYDQTSYSLFMEILNQVEDESETVTELLNNLLYWAIGKQHAFQFNPRTIVVPELVMNTLKVADGAARKKDIQLSHDVPEGLTLFTDSHMLRFIVRNLLANAIKYTSEGGQVAVHAQHHGEVVHVSVTDTGVGLSEAQQAHLFDQVDPYKAKKGTRGELGTGLGLSVAKDFSERMGGSLTVQSQPGQGSRFTLALPQTEATS